MAVESDRYKPDRKGLMLKYGSIAATGVIAGGSLIALGACSSRREQWAETSGKAGQINMEAVDEALKKSENVSDFEKRVNEIYTGDEMVLIEVKNQGREQLVSCYADLNDNSQIDQDEDEKLFTFRRWYDGNEPRYETRGYGVNSYCHHPYSPGTNLLTTYLLVSALSRHSAPNYYYSTIPRDVGVMRNYRTNYRQTPSYRNQVDVDEELLDYYLGVKTLSGFCGMEIGFQVWSLPGVYERLVKRFREISGIKLERPISNK